MGITVIGIDCATKDEKVGLALGSFEEEEARIEKVTIGSSKTPVIETIVDWINQRYPALLALDAPLGWPKRLGEVLSYHEAGMPIAEMNPDKMFHRETDEIVKSKIGKLPLEVGANLIARTAHKALRLLKDLGDKTTGKEIPLAPEPKMLTCTSAIEVYPVATLIAYKPDLRSYKRKDKQDVYQEVLRLLKAQFKLPDNLTPLSKLT
jgi:predicted RNase H-like nuclease